MLWLIGLGLHDEKDVTLRGLEVIKRAHRVFLENYTSILHVPCDQLSAFYGREVELADRELVESAAEVILDAATGDQEAALLVVGDPFAATTHSDLLLRAQERGIPVQVIHNASIMNAVAACGLQLYSFGLTVSIPYYTRTWRPRSFYPKLEKNYAAGLHTLCLLDIKVKEVSEENLARGRMTVFEPPRFMTVNEALQQLQECEEELGGGVCTGDSLVIGLARIGAPDQLIRAGLLKELLSVDFGGPLHALVIPSAEMHEMEYEVVRRMFMAEECALKGVNFAEYQKRLSAME